MTPFARWVAFNFVGAMGMVVQLGVLSLFNRLLHGHYLIASAAALEVTILHNFVWHTQYTWRDLHNSLSRRQQFVRFHLSNGVISLAGNIALMRLFVHVGHLPVLVANAIAILCCSAANFWFSHRWTFSPSRGSAVNAQTSSRATLISPLVALLLAAILTCSKACGQLPDAPSSYRQSIMPEHAATSIGIHASQGSVLANYAYYEAVFCGMGASTSKTGTVPAVACGAGISFPIAPLFLEFGVMGPQANRSYVSGYLSADARLPVSPSRNGFAPLVIIGYSRLFETGHALDYGIGLETPRFGKIKGDGSKALLFELRDYWTFANPSQHNVIFRVGWIVGIPD